jgi:hypothetical protein
MFGLLQSICRFLGVFGLTTSILVGIPFAVVFGAVLAGMDYWHGPPPSVRTELTVRQVKYTLRLVGLVVVPGMVISSGLLFSVDGMLLVGLSI